MTAVSFVSTDNAIKKQKKESGVYCGIFMQVYFIVALKLDSD